MVLYLITYGIVVVAAIYYAVSTIAGYFKVSGASRKAVVITGCDTGFGRLAAVKCFREGMLVFAGCLHEKSVKELEQLATEAGGSLVPFVLDVTSDESVVNAKQLVESRLSKYGGLHAVVNNAGIVRIGFSGWVDLEDYKQMLDIDVLGTVRVNQALLPLLKKSRGGRIVNVSAFLARFAMPGFGPYNTAKFAIEGYTDTLRRELAPFGISVALVQPGWHRTPMGSVGTILGCFESSWKKAETEVQEEYGDQFIKEYSAFTAGYLRSSINSPQPEQVTEAYYHAITSVWPKKNYLVGTFSPFVALLSVLPYPLQDYVWNVTTGAIRYPKPALAALRPIPPPKLESSEAGEEVRVEWHQPEAWPFNPEEYKRRCSKTAIGTTSIDKPSRKKSSRALTPKTRRRLRRQATPSGLL